MNELFDVAVALLIGLFAGKLMNKVKIPLVAGYVLAGLILGQSFLNILNTTFRDVTAPIADLALGFIAFSIGEELKLVNIKKMGRSIPIIATLEAFGAFTLVTGGLLLLGQPLAYALLLGAVSSATAPAATVMVINEFKAQGPLTNTLLAVVAIDDAICLTIYAIASSIARVSLVSTESINWISSIGTPIIDIVSSLALGAAGGLLLSYLIARVNGNSEILVMEVGFIALGIAIAEYFDLSPLLICMGIGTVISNISIKQRQAFEIVGGFVPPIYTLFFVVAGARLDIHLLPKIGLVGIAYLLLRITGKVTGASIGAAVSRATTNVKKYIGFGLLSQIGVAVGLAISIIREFPGTDLGTVVINILLATTIITEIVGPVLTKTALIRSGEAGKV